MIRLQIESALSTCAASLNLERGGALRYRLRRRTMAAMTTIGMATAIKSKGVLEPLAG